MPILLAPIWLLALLPVAVLGALALWRSRHNVQRVSSTRLWQGLSAAAGGAPARSLDPLWMLLLAAAVLATLALARPAWQTRRPAAPAPLPVELAIRGISGEVHAELFVRMPGEPRSLDSLTLDVHAGDVARTYPVDSAAAQRGLVLKDIPAAAIISITAHTRSARATYTFTRNTAQPFALLRGGAPMQPLERVMLLQPGARSDTATLRPAVWLIDDPQFRAADFDPGLQSVVIVSRRTPVEGISSAGPPIARPAGITPQIAAQSPLLASVSLQEVRVLTWSKATLSPAWTVLATNDGDPWLAARTDPQSRVLWIWIGSELAPTSTNWPLDPSFVVFFTNVAAHLRQGDAYAGRVVDWVRQAQAKGTPANAEARIYPLGTALLALAGIMILGVMVLLARRG